MDELWRVLIQFVFRLSFGVALSMLAVSPRWVNSGFYRVHLWVLMAFHTFITLAIYSQRTTLTAAGLSANWLLAVSVTIAVVSYLGAVCWLYEWKRAGVASLMIVTGLSFAGATGMLGAFAFHSARDWLWLADVASSGLLLGSILAAMFLGHWYLNSPGMRLEPLVRLVSLIGVALVFRAVVNGTGLVCEFSGSASLNSTTLVLVGIRWVAGIVGTTVMAVMTWYTLKIPNTQSATGILYAGVIVSFLGELTSQLLSVHSRYPL